MILSRLGDVRLSSVIVCAGKAGLNSDIHAARLIHRDLKPFMVTIGRSKVIGCDIALDEPGLPTGQPTGQAGRLRGQLALADPPSAT